MPGSVAAVVVSYNSASVLGPCLRSLLAGGAREVVVVDNCSADASASVACSAGPQVRWAPLADNVGYGRAANYGAGLCESDYLLVCNPDIDLRGGALAALAAALEEDPALGVVGPRLVDVDGSLYPSARAFPDLADAIGHGLLGMVAPGNPFTRRYRMLDWDHARSARVDWVSGACFMARRAAWDALGGFDPSYFMYLEDVDLCWRLGRAGWGVGYEPSAEVMHVQGVSAGRHPYRMLLAHHLSLWRFASRTTAGRRRLVLPLVGIGLAARLGVASLQHRVRVPWQAVWARLPPTKK